MTDELFRRVSVTVLSIDYGNQGPDNAGADYDRFGLAKVQLLFGNYERQNDQENGQA